MLGPIHFTGIGGIGMSGIAEVLLNHGYAVQGSDLKASKITDRLGRHGGADFYRPARRKFGKCRGGCDFLRHQTGQSRNLTQRAAGPAVVRRAEMLAELMRLRSNVAIAARMAKPPPPPLVATLLDAGGIDPTVINGGIIHAYGSNARMGQGEWMVVEADESDGTFNRLPATIAIVTNIDPEHMEHWGRSKTCAKGFTISSRISPFTGIAVCCTDHPEVQAWWGASPIAAW
jgi:UDP-N-acetylmuramate--alanine ligase